VVSSCALAQTASDQTATAAPVSESQITVDADLVDVPVTVDWPLRMKIYLKKLVSAEAFFEIVPAAVAEHVRTFPHEWRRDGDGFAERLGSQYGQFVFRESIELVISAFHKEDPRYFRVGQGNKWKRTGHALKGAVVVSNTKGGQTAAIGPIAGAYGSWALATRLWEPKSEQNAGQVMLWGSVSIGSKAGANVLREFWPDLKNFFK